MTQDVLFLALIPVERYSCSALCSLIFPVLFSLQESQRAKQQVASLRRENGTLDAECHEKERLLNQLQTRVAVLEQEIKDKDQLILRTKEVLEATQQQKVGILFDIFINGYQALNNDWHSVKMIDYNILLPRCLCFLYLILGFYFI